MADELLQVDGVVLEARRRCQLHGDVGRPRIFYAVVHAAVTLYDSLVARGKHHYVALSAVARKLCGVILALLRDRREYEPRESVQSARAAEGAAGRVSGAQPSD